MHSSTTISADAMTTTGKYYCAADSNVSNLPGTDPGDGKKRGYLFVYSHIIGKIQLFFNVLGHQYYIRTNWGEGDFTGVVWDKITTTSA